jgi:hypothetical protein
LASEPPLFSFNLLLGKLDKAILLFIVVYIAVVAVSEGARRTRVVMSASGWKLKARHFSTMLFTIEHQIGSSLVDSAIIDVLPVLKVVRRLTDGSRKQFEVPNDV